MAANDTALAQETTRVRMASGKILVEVAVVTWPHPHEPSMSWVVAATLPLSSTSMHVEATRNRVVKNRKFFALCHECGKRNLKGHMFSAKVCMSCAEQNHGIIG